jgi:hypothetical protein
MTTTVPQITRLLQCVFVASCLVALGGTFQNRVCYAGLCANDKLCVPDHKQCGVGDTELPQNRACQQYACIDNITNNICGSHVCPAEHQCVEDRNCVGGSANCPKYWCYDPFKKCYPECQTHEMCVRTSYGRYVCAPQMNEINALFDGRPEGDFVACTEHSDCYNHREPMAWGCCMINSIHAWSDRGCYCDTRLGSCAMERREFSWMRWSFCVDQRDFDTSCPKDRMLNGQCTFT